MWTYDSQRGRIASALLLSLALGGVAAAQYPGMPSQGMGASGAMGPKVEQTELTTSSAKGAVDAYLELKEKYGDEVPEANPKKSTLDGFATLDGVTSILSEHGFSDLGNWHTTLVSVAMAYGFTKEGGREQMDESMAELKDNPQIPAALKQRLEGMMKGMRPSDNNMQVVQSLLGDPEYETKLEKISD